MAVGHSGLADEWVVQRQALELESRTPEDVLRWGIEQFGDRLAIATSFQIDGMVIIDMASRIDSNVRVITVDSGRLPEETYDLMDRVRARYGLQIEIYTPDSGELEGFVRREGINAFYRSVPLRVKCCEIRKVNPLRKVLQELDAWVSGLRRDQWTTRKDILKVEVDHDHGGLLKLNPLADWTEDQVWEYIRAHDVPFNHLYQRGYRSIGCAPCTRPTQAEEDPRAGRWWWEEEGRKECGIHCKL